ncbi:uncharacterized protein GLRG_03668, partial [Colletotrichum graminicola M1.001]
GHHTTPARCKPSSNPLQDEAYLLLRTTDPLSPCQGQNSYAGAASAQPRRTTLSSERTHVVCLEPSRSGPEPPASCGIRPIPPDSGI